MPVKYKNNTTCQKNTKITQHMPEKNKNNNMPVKYKNNTTHASKIQK
jgi:hypothetical protein